MTQRTSRTTRMTSKTTRRNFVATVAAFALAFSMLAIAPGFAFAADATTGDLTLSTTTLDVPQSTQVNLTQYCSMVADGDAHYDFKVTSGTAATVNKHSGILTADTPGVVTVTVYLSHGLAPTGNLNNPCYEPPLDQADMTITVLQTESGTYVPGETYQGLNQAITVNKPYTNTEVYVITYDVNDQVIQYDTYLEEDVEVPSDGFIWDIDMSYGTGPNFAMWVANNAGNIILVTPNAETYVLGDMYGYLTLDGTAQSNNVQLSIADDAITETGDYTLTFAAAFSAGNFNNPPVRTLQAPVIFHFTIA